MATYTQTYTFSNGVTADGGQVNTEIAALGSSVNNIVNAQIGSAAAIDISKTTLGTYTAWTSYTPGLVNVTVGNGTLIGYYTQIGKTVIATIRLLWGSTTSFSGEANFAAPVVSSTNSYDTGSWYALDTGTAYRVGSSMIGTAGGPTTYIKLYAHGAGSAVNATTPHTWATGDDIRITIAYQAA